MKSLGSIGITTLSVIIAVTNVIRCIDLKLPANVRASCSIHASFGQAPAARKMTFSNTEEVYNPQLSDRLSE